MKILLACVVIWSTHLQNCAAQWQAGAAKVDITPTHPVRLSGYGNRTTEHEGVLRPIHARALALQWAGEEPILLIAVDNCGIPESLRQKVIQDLSEQKIQPSRLAICASHTHCAPMLTGVLGNLFGVDIPKDEQQRVDNYTTTLTAQIVMICKQALQALRPAKVEHAVGVCRFAMNRRRPTTGGVQNAPNPTGPVDHQLPVLKVSGQDGELIATVASYACHCTTVGMNQIHSDWAGCASDELEQRTPGSVALTLIGCGADQNPNPRRSDDLPLIHGVALAREVSRLIQEPMRSLSGPLIAGVKHIELPFAERQEADLQGRTKTGSPASMRHARLMLERLHGPEGIPKSLAYQVMAWRFGRDLDMVFLNGEVVVDYGLRLKSEFGAQQLWVNAYSNDAPCYIPSERVLSEGGYEADSSMLYYLRPGPFAPGLEDKIINAIHELLPSP